LPCGYSSRMRAVTARRRDSGAHCRDPGPRGAGRIGLRGAAGRESANLRRRGHRQRLLLLPLDEAGSRFRASQSLCSGATSGLVVQQRPLGTNNIDSKGRDLRKVCEPREISQAHPAEGSQGVLQHNGPAKTRILSPGFAEPSGVRSSGMLPEGDFRAWDEIESWASGIYRELQRTPNILYETPTLMP